MNIVKVVFQDVLVLAVFALQTVFGRLELTGSLRGLCCVGRIACVGRVETWL